MPDKQIIRLAAKAVGYQILFAYDEGIKKCMLADGRVWSPFESDGDAFCVAVGLSMTVSVCARSRCSFASLSWDGVGLTGKMPDIVCVEHNGDPKAATRRAILVLAAKVGETMTEEFIEI